MAALEFRLYAREVLWHPAGAPEPLVLDVGGYVRGYFERVLGADPDPDVE